MIISDTELITEKYPVTKNCIVVRGNNTVALYDFNVKKVFSINDTAADILELCDGKKTISDINIILSDRYKMIDGNEVVQYILELRKKKLIEMHQYKQDQQDVHRSACGDYDRCLKMLHCEITSRCNLRCLHCYGGFGNFSVQNDELSTNEWKKVISEAKALETETLQFIGGEPMVRKDFLELFHFAYDLNFKWIDIFTNGTLVDEDIAEQTAKLNVEIRFSVYGHNPEIHDEITQVKGSFNLLMDGIKKLKKYNNRLRAEAILNVKNINYKEEIDSFFRKAFDIPVHFGISRPAGVKDFDLVPGIATEKYCEFPPVFKRASEGEICFEIADYFIRNKWNECFAGRLCIKANGDVIPCIFARDLLIGNIRNKSLVELYKEDAGFIRDNYKIDNVDKCKNCELRYACRDCRPWAYSITGDWHAKNPYCHYKSERGDKFEEKSRKTMEETECARAIQ